MTDAITGELRALAGPDLYRRNAFRISGLMATVDRRTTRQVLQRLRAALQVGADVDLGPNASSDPDEVQAACDLILGDPRRRLVHEVFAPWGYDISKCGCPAEIHEHHDTAVEVHALAIESELTNDQKIPVLDRNKHWITAGKIWGPLLETTEFWEHLDHRVSELDDRQLGRSALDLIDDEIRRTLVKPLTDLALTTDTKPARLVQNARKWPAPATMVDRQLEAAAGPLYDELEDRRVALTRRLRDEAVDPIAAEIDRDVVPKLHKLDALVPPDRHHRTATLHDQFALLLNNCAVQLLNRGEVTDGRAERWLNTAAKLAIDQRDQELIKANRGTLRESNAAMQEFEQQVLTVLRLRGKNAALTLLRQVRRQNHDPMVLAEIDRMMREVTNGTFETRRVLAGAPPRSPAAPSYSPEPTYYYRPRRRWGRVLFWLLVIAGIVYGVTRCGPFGGTTMSVYSAKIADNAKPGTCLDKQDDDWLSKPSELRIRDCDEPHWAEVLAYVQLSKVPAPYPGDAQASALAAFQCGEKLSQQNLSPSEYTIEKIFAPGQYWNTGTNGNNKYENYAACVVRRADGQEIPAGQKVKEHAPTDPKTVEMSLFGADIAGNAPIGTCLETEHGAASPTGPVPVVRCEARHWAQVFGYPVIFKPGEKWPGDDAVYARAKRACAKLIPGLAGYTTTVGWPDRSWWNNPKQAIYTYCLVHRADNAPFEGRLK